MKPTGYWPCRNEIINAHLSAPHKYEPFTELFDTEKLDEIRSKYGADLYKECYTDALYEVVEAANVTSHLRLLGVSLRPLPVPHPLTTPPDALEPPHRDNKATAPQPARA